MIQMSDGERTLTMTRCGLIQIPEKRLLRICCTSSITLCDHFLSSKLGSFSIEGPFTYWGNLLARTCLPVQPIHGSSSFRLWHCIVILKIGFEQLERGI